MNSSPEGTASAGNARDSGPSVLWMLAALTAVFAWRVFFTYWSNLLPDECSYWTWSRQLDWAYFDNSGMVAYLIRLATALLRAITPFSVRLPFLVLSFVSTYLLYRVGVLLFGDKSCALSAATAFNLMPVALLGGSTAIHDNALIFFWIASLWSAARFLKSPGGHWFYIMGLFAGLDIQSKYTGVLILPCLFIFLLWSKDHRSWLVRKEPWIGLLIACVFVLPILWWNFRHEWASLHHILFIGAGSDDLFRRLADGVAYHLAQFLLVSPFFYAAIVVALAAGLANNILRPRTDDILLLCFSLPLLVFGVMAFRGHVEANWAFMGYASSTLFAVAFIARTRSDRKKGIWMWFGPRFRKWGVILAVGPTLLMVLHAWIGLVPASVEKKLGKADRIIWETRGWDGLGKHVAGLLKEGDVVAADSYQLCALLEFNVPGNPRVRYLAPWRRPTQFDVREPSYDNLQGRTILFVTPRPLEPSSSALTTIYENFTKVEPLTPYEVLYHGVPIRAIYVYRCHEFNPFSPRKLGPKSLLYKDH